MKITKVEPIILKVPASMGMDETIMSDDVVVRVETDEGLSGIGETAGPPFSVMPLIRSVHQGTWYKGFEDILVGEDPLDVERLWEKMYRYSLHYGSRGLIVWAMSAIDIALWDILGKAQKQPVFKLLGGGGKPIPAYASLPSYATSEELIAACEEVVKKYNFTAIKFHTDPARLHDDTWVRFTKAVREHFGSGLTLMLDAHNEFGTEEAIKFAKALEPYGVYFFEAALLPDNIEGYAKLSESTEMLVAAGEEFTTRFMYRDLIERGNIDVVQLDVTLGGGITDGIKVARLAKERGRLLVPHSWNTDISFAANLHFASAAGSPFVEWPISKSPLRNALTRERIPLDPNGSVTPTTSPGLGVTLDESIVETYRFKGPLGHY
ncbi:MAG: mandelate racemase/muconate lactonizing enzyme family protein [Thaumarchaeota archaeon]|nr:mandelate racemase/muconate lactonizing enzyme family protein [Nitrososphaerota archaeon]